MTMSTFASLGAGTQPEEEDGTTLQYMQMPDGMMTFARPNIPEPETASDLDIARETLERVLLQLRSFRPGDMTVSVDLAHLDQPNLRFVDQMLGSGEVSIVAGPDVQVQESVLAGVWRVRHLGAEGKLARDVIEIGYFPTGVYDIAFADAQSIGTFSDAELPPGVQSAPALMAEINDNNRQPRYAAGAYAINLTLLPHSQEDLAFLSDRLGPGKVIVLSRGYGNCRISSTGTRNVWWVQYFNSQDALILNSLEITNVPEVACAAIEDIVDSAERLDEILEIYR